MQAPDFACHGGQGKEVPIVPFPWQGWRTLQGRKNAKEAKEGGDARR